ncbi:hypothetical protein, partial [Streptomyces rhizosphaericus]|uniref:hypothetical protein n=1 Tax=Streptomyces rhizosphaericus TaxID=114699 RepID=UPI0031D76171
MTDEDKPVVAANGLRQWFVDGQRHREGGPARVYRDGASEWWLEGEKHRTNGPAVDDPLCGDPEFWVHGDRVPDAECLVGVPERLVKQV